MITYTINLSREDMYSIIGHFKDGVQNLERMIKPHYPARHNKMIKTMIKHDKELLSKLEKIMELKQ